MSTVADRERTLAPRNDVEARLAAIWERRLRVAGIGVDDEFFELGGDSILALQIVAECAQAGLHFTLAQFLRCQTIARLAAELQQASGTSAELSVPRPAAGPVDATPNMLWFFEKGFIDPHHCNGTLLLELPGEIDPAILRRAVQHVWTCHEGLRLRFTGDDAAGWRQFVNDGDVPFVRIDLSDASEAEQRQTIERTCAELQGSLNLSSGPNVRFCHFDLGRHGPGRLLMVLHYLVLDNVSRSMLIDMLHTVVRQLQNGEPLPPPPPAQSFRTWARRLSDLARSAAVLRERDYWVRQCVPSGELPLDHPEGANTNEWNRDLTVWLGAEETKGLAERIAATHGARLNEVLLAAVLRTLADWRRSPMQQVELVGHGRGRMGEGVDPSTIVGRIATHFPFAIDLSTCPTAADALSLVQQRLREIPNGGIGYGLLRYLGADRELSRRLTVPEDVWFDYAGQILEQFAGSLFKPAAEWRGPDRSARQQRAFVLRVAALIDKGRLRIEWWYCEALHRRSTMESLARQVLDEVRSFL